MVSAGGRNIKVVVRVRPFNARELERNAQCVVQTKDGQIVLTPPSQYEGRNSKGSKASLEVPKSFAFDKSYWSFDREDPHFAGQDDLFADLGRPLLDNAFQGYNNCIFAYGQTGSGKSYSMMGYGEDSGVIPRICRHMFEKIEKLQQDEHFSCTVEVSYLEIYNERVRDLLNPTTKGNLKVREHPATGPYVEDLAKLVVRSFNEIESLMDEGNKARTVAATNMNETSSRSHAVFTLTLTQKRHDVETNMDMEKVAKISLVDLAGSERATSTGATGARLKEGAEINRSLSTLGRVIAALADLSSGKKKNMSVVPYRDSVLTWLLKDSLGGNSMTAMIAAISPADINFEETLSTLRYADSAKRIKNHAVVNEDANARMIRELKEELGQLRAKLSGSTTSGGGAEQPYGPDTPLEKQIVSITQADGTIKKVSKAEIAEQLSQSEKLYKDLNQTWEEKLQRTEQIHKEREAALEELGISIEKGFIGVSTPKKMPHLVNLSDDPLLAECLVYNLKPGSTTVGNMDNTTSVDIRLNGSKILREHCTFENVDGIVSVVPQENAAVMVNGIRIETPKRLRSGYRIILGDFHIFRFNHPLEARAERAEQGSLLRQSVIASQLESPAPRPNHDRSWSNMSHVDSELEQEVSRDQSSALSQRDSRDADWAYARREAASAILGPDQKILNLTDDELDVLLDDMQKIRAIRRGRPESRLFDRDEDDDSEISYPVREKYLSNGTMDNLSLETALTIPSTPQLGEDDERLRLVREEMQDRIDKQNEEFQDKLKSAAESNVEMEEIRAEKVRIEENLRLLKEEMQSQLQQQKEEFERQLKELCQPTSPIVPDPEENLSLKQIQLAQHVNEYWQRRKYVRMAEAILHKAGTLKEAQVLSQQMDKSVVFQFTIVDIGHTLASSYDLVLNGVSTDDDDDLDLATKPCVAVRIIDFKHSVIHLWSLQKLDRRLELMRQMHQYLERPEYLQHFRLGNPFSEACMPQHSRIGDADVPLMAVFEAKVQDFSLDVISPYTLNVVGIVNLSLEPSSAEAPSSTLKFNVVMHDMVGFPEREGTDVHAQLYLPGTSEEGGATTTQLIKGFDEGPVRFESVHSMSLPFSNPKRSSLRISIFARVTSTHMDKLLSWDDMRDSAQIWKQKRRKSRLPESHFFSEERHDVFTKAQILELAEDGEYQAVEVVQNSVSDAGIYQVHQGLQRRIVISCTSNSGDAFQATVIKAMHVGNIKLLDPGGTIPDINHPQPHIPLQLVKPPEVGQNADGTSIVTLIGQWDSSAHNSLLLNRTTAERHRVQISVMWDFTSTKLSEPMAFALDLAVQIRPRAQYRYPSALMKLWSADRVVHSTTGIFEVALKPSSVKCATDLWRMNTRHTYVKGEEMLSGWAPRGVSLIHDFTASLKKRQRIADIETAKTILGAQTLRVNDKVQHSGTEQSSFDEREQALLRRVLDLWTTTRDSSEVILTEENTEPPANSAAFANTSHDSSPPSLTADIRLMPKNPSVLKSGFLFTPDGHHKRWVRRYVELRRPYLHVYSVPEGDEINAINLRNSRIDHKPEVAKLLQRPDLSGRGVLNIWAIYATQNTWLLANRSERDKAEWILRIDESYWSPEGSEGGSEADEV